MSDRIRALEEQLEALLARIQAGGSPLASLVAEARHLDERLVALHTTLASERSVEGYEVARELAVARDALCAQIGLAIVRGDRIETLASADETGARAPSTSVHDEPVPAADIATPSLPPTPSTAPATATEPMPPVPASERDVSSFKERFSNSRLGTGATLTQVHAEPPVWWGMLEEILAHVGAPPIAERQDEFDAEVTILVGAVAEGAISKWRMLPGEVQRAWLSMLAARVRRMRDSERSSAVQADQLRDVFVAIQSYTKEHRSGHVNGLALRHRAAGETWRDDALRYWNELQSIVDGLEPPHGDERAPHRPVARAAPPVERISIPENWPFWSLLRDKTVALVGGEPRETNRIRLERALRVGSLDWVSSKAPRRHDALVQAIVGGGVDVVLVVRNLMAHSIQEKILRACDDRGVPWAIVDGYGVVAITRAIERQHGRRGVAE